MTNHTVLTIVAATILGLLCLSIGIAWGPTLYKLNKGVNYNDLPTILANLQPGDRVEISMEEGVTPSRETQQGATVNMMNRTDAVRNMSWFGLGGGETIAKDQGINVSKAGDDVSIGQMKGYGFLEQLWERVKSFFWFGVFAIVVLVILLFIPATAPVAGSILRVIASVIPGLGSIVERLFAGFQWKKPLNQVVAGGQGFKDRVNNADYLTQVQKDKLIADFKAAQMEKQDTGVQKQVQNIKVENGL